MLQHVIQIIMHKLMMNVLKEYYLKYKTNFLIQPLIFKNVLLTFFFLINKSIRKVLSYIIIFIINFLFN